MGKEEKEGEAAQQCFANYWMGNAGSNEDGHPPEYDGELGLAMEKLPEGVDRKSLWQIIC